MEYTRYQEDLGRQLAEARASLGWSQDQLAERAQVSVSTVSNVERGRAVAAHRSLLRMCAAMGMAWPDVVARAWRAQYGLEPVRVTRLTVREGGLVGVADAPCEVRDGVLRHGVSGDALAGALWADMGRGRRCRVTRAGSCPAGIALWHVEIEHVGALTEVQS